MQMKCSQNGCYIKVKTVINCDVDTWSHTRELANFEISKCFISKIDNISKNYFIDYDWALNTSPKQTLVLF